MEKKTHGWFFLLPLLLLFTYPTVAGFLVKSDVPLLFNRYSPYLLGFNVWNSLLLAFGFFSFFSGRHLRSQWICLLVVFTSLLVPGNNLLRKLPLILIVLPSIRLTSSFAILYIEFERFKKKQGRHIFIAIGAFFLIYSVLDLALLGWVTAFKPDYLYKEETFRREYQVSEIGQNDILIVGDSFVWGQGVLEKESFGNVLQRLYRIQNKNKKVYSFGAVGANLNKYKQFLKMIPESTKADRIIVSFYLNDMPPKPTFSKRIIQSLGSLGYGSFSFRLAEDITTNLLTANVEQYHQQLIKDFDKTDASFSRRWSILSNYLDEIAEIARTRSRSPPVLLIIPLMVDFSTYPLSEIHGDLNLLAKKKGFQVFDLLPLFTDKLKDGENFRVHKNDNHFNAFVHNLVAMHLKRFIEKNK